MRITVTNRQKAIKFDLHRLNLFARRALEECLVLPSVSAQSLQKCEIIEVTVVSDRCIADLHRRFMDMDGPTDVLTFDHGEIIISADTAGANAAFYGKTLEKELGLYIIHGLLHLDGFSDAEPEPAAEMARTQERILQSCIDRLDEAKI